MSAAIMNGVQGSTLDTDLWIDLPERQYMRVINLCIELGGNPVAKTVVEFPDSGLVNFLYRVDGLASFETERRKTVTVLFHGQPVRSLSVAQVIKSKEFLRRPKDVIHLHFLKEALERMKQQKPIAKTAKTAKAK